MPVPRPSVDRRGFLVGASAAVAGVALGSTTGHTARADAATPPPAAADDPSGIALHWLDGTPAASTGSSFGVPWPRGTVARGAGFALQDDQGAPVPVQSWPLAYWPDGSLKWSGHAVPAAATAPSYRLRIGPAARPAVPVQAFARRGGVRLQNGTVRVDLAGHGSELITGFSRDRSEIARSGRLVLEVQDDPDDGARSAAWVGEVERAEIEQHGPVRAVVALHGHYRPADGGGVRHRLLPWTVRVYLGAGAESIRLVHSVLWDADSERQFVRGLGLRLDVPLADATHDRHVRFGTESGGIWGEPVRVLTGLRRDPGAAVRAAQVAGTATPPVATWSAEVRDGYQELAEWNDYTLFQGAPDSFAIWKRTSAHGSWIKHAGHGSRASGFGYVGGVSGGLGVGLHEFWQRFPRGIDVRGAAGDTATVTVWSWAPLGGAMDLRPYDTVAHGLDLAYEDVQPGFGTPVGIARSTELELWAFPATPARETITALSATLTAPPQLVAEPAWYHGAGVFGRWSLPDRSTSGRAALEESITRDVAFYRGQVEQRQWYGFWNHGDVMHTYDPDRHEWRYDVGGFAWDNGELGTDAMLWYQFLRTGDAATFRLARAMTRHVAEVDTYHVGRFAGLGSRHNVQHWGDGAKEARVGESYTKRFAYYLTADELLGDLLRSTLAVDQTLVHVDPLREVLPPQHTAPARVRIGPDWYALVSNWLTEWERTGDTRWRDRIVTGMRDIATFPAGLFTGEAGGAVGFDPRTAHLVNFDKGDFDGGYNLAMAFLGEQILWEALDLVDVPEFRQTYVDFARYVQAPSAEKIARYGRDFNPQVFGTIYSRMTAWAGEQLNEPEIRSRGWQKFLTDRAGKPWPPAVQVAGDAVPEPVDEIPVTRVADATVATNDAAQRTLAIITLLAIAPEDGP